jgi:hypothetical protein
VANQTDPARIDLRTALQKRNGSLGVRREIDRCRPSEIAGRGAGAAFIVAEYGKAMAVERVSENQKDLVAEDLLVARLRAPKSE